MRLNTHFVAADAKRLKIQFQQNGKSKLKVKYIFFVDDGKVAELSFEWLLKHAEQPPPIRKPHPKPTLARLKIYVEAGFQIDQRCRRLHVYGCSAPRSGTLPTLLDNVLRQPVQ